MRSVLWIPGRFSLTNKMLSNLRAAGAAGEAYRRALNRHAAAHRPKDLFAEETQAIRLAVKGAARVAKAEPVVGLVSIEVYVFGHHKHDPDAWLLLAKAATDGLVDAGVIGSDRFQVWTVTGRVAQTEDEERALVTRAVARGLVIKGTEGEGFLLGIETANPPCEWRQGHA
jgi:hypothetical protein